jgi:hypothetical protein
LSLPPAPSSLSFPSPPKVVLPAAPFELIVARAPFEAHGLGDLRVHRDAVGAAEPLDEDGVHQGGAEGLLEVLPFVPDDDLIARDAQRDPVGHARADVNEHAVGDAPVQQAAEFQTLDHRLGPRLNHQSSSGRCTDTAGHRSLQHTPKKQGTPCGVPFLVLTALRVFTRRARTVDS